MFLGQLIVKNAKYDPRTFFDRPKSVKICKSGNNLRCFYFVRMFQIDGLEGTEKLVMIRLLLRETSRKKREVGRK